MTYGTEYDVVTALCPQCQSSNLNPPWATTAVCQECGWRGEDEQLLVIYQEGKDPEAEAAPPEGPNPVFCPKCGHGTFATAGSGLSPARSRLTCLQCNWKGGWDSTVQVALDGQTFTPIMRQEVDSARW